MSKLTYKDAGVDVEAGYEAVKEIKGLVQSTRREEVLTDIGGFGGVFAPQWKKFRNPVLVSGTDGVGTKLKLAFMADKHDTVGIDLVAMSVNDILAQGAEPLFFLDYIATGKIEPKKVRDIVSGIAAACKDANCAILGGETAEMPGFYRDNEYDLAGFAVGIAEKDKLLPRKDIRAGDKLIALASSGVHSNGYSLVRKIVFEKAGLKIDSVLPDLGMTMGEAFLEPTRIYVKEVLPLLAEDLVKGIVHITGGGFYENIPRILPENLAAAIDLSSWEIPGVFKVLAKLGNVEKKEMFNTFNMGAGMILVVNAENVASVMKKLQPADYDCWVIGEVVEGKRGVLFRG